MRSRAPPGRVPAMSKSLHKRHVAENLNAVIEAVGRGPTYVAREIGVTASKLGNWTRGDNYPDPYAMMKLCDRFGVSMDWIYRRRIFGLDDTLAAGLRAAEAAWGSAQPVMAGQAPDKKSRKG